MWTNRISKVRLGRCSSHQSRFKIRFRLPLLSSDTPYFNQKRLLHFQLCCVFIVDNREREEDSLYLLNIVSMSGGVKILSKTRVGGSNGGYYQRVQHESTSTCTPMIFGLYLPASAKVNVPVLFWLSGLTCDDTNFANKAGSRAFAAAEQQVGPTYRTVENVKNTRYFLSGTCLQMLQCLLQHHNEVSYSIWTCICHGRKTNKQNWKSFFKRL